MDFRAFKLPVAKQFEKLSKHKLLKVDIDKDALWDAYLASFPEGTNPIFRERREYDCSCCRQFIRTVGDVVAVVDGQIVSIWDIVSDEPAFQVVANALSALVKERAVSNFFLHTEKTAGTDKNFEQTTEHVVTWTHFFVNVPAEFRDLPTRSRPPLRARRLPPWRCDSGSIHGLRHGWPGRHGPRPQFHRL